MTHDKIYDMILQDKEERSGVRLTVINLSLMGKAFN